MNADLGEGALIGSSLAVILLNHAAKLGALKPKFSVENGYYYELPGLTLEREELKDALNELVLEGYLDRELYFKSVKCHVCGSFDVTAFYTCPYCGSKQFEKQTLVEHLSCGYMGVINGFNVQEGLRCPRCKVEVKPDSLRRAGVWFKCLKCGKISSNLTSLHLCRNCGAEFTLNDAEFEDVYIYRLTRLGERRLRDEKAIRKPLMDTFKKHGYVLEELPRVKGISGMTYNISLLFVNEAGNRVGVIFIPGDKRIGLEEVVKLISEVTDMGMPMILVTPKELTDEVKKIASFYKLNITSSSNPEELKSMVKEFLSRGVAS